ncbi:hypothetical protein CENSYa_0886 [Cenarchaeum symbiosum A]|uniref:Uncharacterized protein n=1 Tax=Cenarchaeum symbiosum (strain A) TaxID=414004 RepID=A0RW01_CENSY|nr:hypothetical protein CENSYa_0886 [Cenarchaeum symbiosum A]
MHYHNTSISIVSAPLPWHARPLMQTATAHLQDRPVDSYRYHAYSSGKKLMRMGKKI